LGQIRAEPIVRAAVISQSMYFPWVGLLEQIQLADIFIHYDDVQFARGFYNRVQVKTQVGMKWLTVPLRDYHRGQKLGEILIDDRVDWRSRHRDILRQAYLKAPFCCEMLALVDEVFAQQCLTLAQLSRQSLLALANYFNLVDGTEFKNSIELKIKGRSTERLRDLCMAVGANVYITGHGAQNYLDYALFEQAGIAVEYMRYKMQHYSQQFGNFTPYVTGLDLVANCGQYGKDLICSKSINWRKFIDESN
jgi:hypothetical protein